MPSNAPELGNPSCQAQVFASSTRTPLLAPVKLSASVGRTAGTSAGVDGFRNTVRLVEAVKFKGTAHVAAEELNASDDTVKAGVELMEGLVEGVPLVEGVQLAALLGEGLPDGRLEVPAIVSASKPAS